MGGGSEWKVIYPEASWIEQGWTRPYQLVGLWDLFECVVPLDLWLVWKSSVHRSEISCEIERNSDTLVKLKGTLTECFKLFEDVYNNNVMLHTSFWLRFQPFDIKNQGNHWENQWNCSRCLSIQMNAEIINKDKEAVRQTLHNWLNMGKVCKNGSKKNLSGTKRQVEKHFLWHHGTNHRTAGCAWKCYQV